MGKRFSRLKYGLKLIRDIDTPNTPVNAPAGSALANYQDFASGNRVVTINRATDSLPEKIFKVAINPFGIELAAGNELVVAFSKRASDFSTLTTVKTACNHQVADATDPVAKSFVPAKTIVAIPAETVSTPTSGITGRSYKTKKAKSYTYPYGQVTSKIYESVVRTDILTAALTASANAIVTFNSEEL